MGNDKHGYYISSGKIREVWAKSGYESGMLGFPVSEVYRSGAYLVQKYQHGTIKYDTGRNTAWY